MKCKIFEGRGHEVEKAINDWLQKVGRIKILHLKMQSVEVEVMSFPSHYVLVFIIFKEEAHSIE